MRRIARQDALPVKISENSNLARTQELRSSDPYAGSSREETGLIERSDLNRLNALVVKSGDKW